MTGFINDKKGRTVKRRRVALALSGNCSMQRASSPNAARDREQPERRMHERRFCLVDGGVSTDALMSNSDGASTSTSLAAADPCHRFSIP
ncbi:TPA: hypothetical protein QDB43_001198 [Burkholderia vietnamiensis]|nr:hypothetical protein [Burkholderia vietnamiensis]